MTGATAEADTDDLNEVALLATAYHAAVARRSDPAKRSAIQDDLPGQTLREADAFLTSALRQGAI